MRIIPILFITLLLSACMYRVDVTNAHTDLVGEWRLKVDAYFVQYSDQPYARYAHPYASQYSADPTDYETTPVATLIGKQRDSGEVVGTISKGTVITITQVIEDHHATMGTSFRPYALLKDARGKVHKVDFVAFCRDHPYEELFDTKWTERVK